MEPTGHGLPSGTGTYNPHMEDHMQDRVYVEDASVLLRRAPRTLRRWVRDGYGPRAHRDRQRIFYLREDIESFLDSQIN